MKTRGQTYDVVVIGSGLGGLVSAVVLAKEGKKVCVLEKNNQFGGNLQTFARNKKIFDTGVHYLPALDAGQNLDRYFTYLGIRKDMKIKRMPEVYDQILFEGDKQCYPHAQGKDNFVDKLSQLFPKECKAIEQYVDDIDNVCQLFPLYTLSKDPKNSESLPSISVQDYFDQLTTNPRLKAVLMGTNFLYAGDSATTPFYVHALTVYAYMQSAYKCINGGSQITKLLVHKIRELGGVCMNRQEITNYCVEKGKLVQIETQDGNQYKAADFISNIDPKNLLAGIGESHFRKIYYRRIMDMPVGTSSFSLHIVLKAKRVAYMTHNLFVHANDSSVGHSMHYEEGDWLSQYMISMVEDSQNPGFAESLTLLTYMNFDEVKGWEKTFNTVLNKQERDMAYDQFKKEKTRLCLTKLENILPTISASIIDTYASTPLTYRDYIGSYKGSMYGHAKTLGDPMHSFISPRTKISNLYMTGQGINMHGILGVTIGAIATCGELLGSSYLIDKIRSEVMK